MFDCAEASACFCFTIKQGCSVVREDSSSRNSPTTGRSNRIACNPHSSGSDSLVGDKKERKKFKKGIGIYFAN